MPSVDRFLSVIIYNRLLTTVNGKHSNKSIIVMVDEKCDST